MIFAVLGIVFWLATTTIVARYEFEPYLFRRLVRTRLVRQRRGVERPVRRRGASILWRRTTTTARASDHERLAAVLDTIGRELRLGTSLNAAVCRSIERHMFREWDWIRTACQDGESIGNLIEHAPRSTSRHALSREAEDLALCALVASGDGGDATHAVETAARSLRARAAIAHELHVAAAHTRASMAVLTWVPIVFLFIMLRSGSVRSFLFSLGGLVCIALALSLQTLGRRWMHKLTNRATEVGSHLPDFIDLVIVHLRAGAPPAMAFLAATNGAYGDTAASVLEIRACVEHGERFVDALLDHRGGFEPSAQPLIDALVDTERDGLPPRELFDRVATEAHAQRRREADARVRALPVRLTLPLVCCILPAYLLLAVVPLLVSQFPSVTLDLP